MVAAPSGVTYIRLTIFIWFCINSPLIAPQGMPVGLVYSHMGDEILRIGLSQPSG